MLCQRCKKNQAEYYYKQNINGNISEVALCKECASEQEKSFFADDALNLLGGFFGYPTVSKARALPKKVCPSCGSSFSDLRKTGKAGCAQCYKTFEAELTGSVKSIHGSVSHKGKAPGNFKDKAERSKLIDRLKSELDAAIANEEYEKAAKIRDEIRSAKEDV